MVPSLPGFAAEFLTIVDAGDIDPLRTRSHNPPMPGHLPQLTALQYVQPLREGGSLPAVVATDDGLYVVKFRGAGQGPKALIAELVCGLLARALDLPTPGLAVVRTNEIFGRSEPDPEIQDLLRASVGVNIGIRYLDGAFNFALAAAQDVVSEGLAARIVWFDSLITNPDRTPRNPNILVWQRRPYLIDHGAALYAHHDWPAADEQRTRTPFPLVRRHVLLPVAGDIGAVDAGLAGRLSDDVLKRVLDAVPDELLCDERTAGEFATADAQRARYLEYLHTRLAAPRAFGAAAEAERVSVRAAVPTRVSSRR